MNEGESGKVEAAKSWRFYTKKSKVTGEQIAFALRQAEVGTPIAEVCWKMGVSEATYYR